MKRRISRTTIDLINALEQHLDLLRDHINKFKSGDFKYYKPIMTELRLLVYKSKTNNPLLIFLAQQNGIALTIHRDAPPFKKQQLSLDEFLHELYFASGTAKMSLTNIEFIAKAAQQEGSAHEDLKHDLDYIISKGDGVLIGGLPPQFRAAVGLAECIYSCGIRVLIKIKQKQEEKMYTLRVD